MVAQLQVRTAGPADRPAVARFNARLKRGGVRYALPLDPRLPGEAGADSESLAMHREMLLAWDGDEVRAGLLLHHGTLWLRGEERPFCWLGLPLSEGLIDRRHTMAIVHLVSSVLAREPLLMDLGIGSLDETIAQFLMQLGWRYATVPFMFHPVRARRVLLGLSYLRSKPRLLDYKQ